MKSSNRESSECRKKLPLVGIRDDKQQNNDGNNHGKPVYLPSLNPYNKINKRY
jgi:hypothetical protein